VPMHDVTKARHSPCPPPEVLAARLEPLRDEMRRRFSEFESSFGKVRPNHRQSAANLIDYLTLRQYDLRDIQDSLAELGLSSLGRTEEHVIVTVERVIDNLKVLAGTGEWMSTESAVSFWEGRELLRTNTLALLGPLRPGRSTRILVTMPSEAAQDYDLVLELMTSGMDCARINCAHDTDEQWLRMVENIRRAEAETGGHCPVLMDLPGPKLRTGPIESGPKVVRLRPVRDARGRSIVPARALLVAESSSGAGQRVGEVALTRIPVRADWLSKLRVGARLTLRDTRDSTRELEVTSIDAAGVEVHAHDTTYIGTGTVLNSTEFGAVVVGDIPAVSQAIILKVGDVLTLSSDLSPALANSVQSDGRDVGQRRSKRSSIGCTMPEVFRDLKVGDRVLFDDGKIGGEAINVRPTGSDVRITSAAPGGSKLRAEKGINLPDTDLHLPLMSPEDELILRFVVAHADLVELSFTQAGSDVATLQKRLEEFGGSGIGIVLKIETVRGFNALPEILLTAMASERIGVMVARGDLAIECGFERLAEVQEEMLCLCDAAHVPVIWATQVLDQMARTGQPSRAEISDAAMAGRAECVMLNKGPYIVQAVRALDDIIHRMSSHQSKKINLLRRLTSWPLESE
jgi:pyruvate kinase